MTYRVVLDYGDIEMVVYQHSHQLNGDDIMNEAIATLKERGFGLPPDGYTVTVEAVPEWEED